MHHRRVSHWWTALLVLALMAATPAVTAADAAADHDLLRPMDLFDLEYAVDPRISPDGERIVYVRQFADVMTDQRYSNLWIVDFDGTNHRPLTTGNFRDASPRWSPDGDRLIYISNRDGSPQIHLRWMDSGETARLTRLTTPPGGISWSPDGSKIAFTARVPGESRSIIEMPPAPEGAEWAEPATIIDRLFYRWDGVGYFKSGYTHLFVVPAEGGTARQLTDGNYNHTGPFGGSDAVWTPDSKFLLVTANRKKDFEYEPMDTEIYEVTVADGATRALTTRKGPDNAPAVSPDGSKIAYLGFDDRYQGYQVTRLYVMNRDGGRPQVVTHKLDRSVSSPRWSPNGDSIYFLYSSEGNTRLARTSLEGSVEDLADHVGSGWLAYPMGTSFTLASGGRMTHTYTTPDRPGDIAVNTLASLQTHLITNVNEDVLSHKTLGQVEEIWYESSHDGRKIQGWIIKPPHFDAKKKYPLILEIHGGPFANYGVRFDTEKQIWAAQDYVVLYANPRGSTSYGEKFGNLIHHAYPGDDFYDLNSGVDAVIARGYIDTDNLFVTGGSGGGVLTCWMIGRSDRFRAAVSAYPVINWYSFVLTADASSFFVKYWFPGLPWDHTEHYMKRSLLSVVGNVTTPTMVITGEEDYRTPMSESEQYYLALKLMKLDTVLVRVPGEPHGIRVRPSHHVSKVMNISGWFEEHKKN